MSRRSVTPAPGQLALAFDAYAMPNDAGVYLDCERLTFAGKGGRPSAEIRIASAPFGFCWGISVMFSNSGFSHMPNESDFKSGEFALTRMDALRRACASLSQRIGAEYAGATTREVVIVGGWAKGLCV